MIVPFAYPLFGILLATLTVVGFVRALQQTRRQRAWVIAALSLWLVALLYMTVRSGSGGVRLNLVPIIVDGPGSARDALLNVAVFLPFGMLLATIGWRLLPVLGIALAVSGSIETTQYLLNWGRTADVNDLITNVLGAGLGWVVVWVVSRSAHRAGRIAVPSS
jgi:glycopeptide antibiotics resistance protein